MHASHTHLSTGLPGLDHVFQGLRPGDNVVWQVDSVADYVPFVQAYARWAETNGKRLIYFRFAKHEPLLPENSKAELHQLHPDAGFESFITRIHEVIQSVGQDAFYVFDALSELALDQYSDRMLGNFYMVTCPYLYALKTVAYYALLKNYHSFHASSPIAETTQILVDVYRHKDKLYVHPRKVKNRYSPTMHMLHVWEGDEFNPVTESNETSEVLTSVPWSGINAASERPGGWTRTFLHGEETLAAFRRGETPAAAVEDSFKKCLRAAITRDERALVLCEKYSSLEGVLEVKKRMLSSGLIGGKSVGMLLARAILRRASPRWNDLLEPHDSFFIGSEVFYTFLVHNQCWRLRQNQKDPARFLEGADEARQRMLMGSFPDYMRERFVNMLDYFGLSPIIVRSSSLLEDNFGNAFAGKYDSVFCANQGPKHIRLEDFMAAVRTVYASSMSEEALTYRAERGVLDKDEQMALLVQRVSGIRHGSYFFPHAAGVAFSFNPYAWSSEIDPKAGLVRLVFGLGTRAVDRADDDYTRVVALNAPTRRPEADLHERLQYSQRRIDVLNLAANSLDSCDFVDLARSCPHLPLDILASKNEEAIRRAEERGMRDVFPWVLTFEGLLNETPFVSDMREMLQILQEAYGCPVDVEFTLNFTKDGRYKINLLQCRPLAIKGSQSIVGPDLTQVTDRDIVLRSSGPVIGQSRLCTLDRIIYVLPQSYSKLTTGERYEIAQVIGRLTQREASPEQSVLLMGPGRWGTSTPALGIPVTFRDIRRVSAICEIVAMHDDLVPDVSLGTHFFSDFIETDILYMALYPNRGRNYINAGYFEKSRNVLVDILPSASKWAHVIRVVDTVQAVPDGTLKLYADAVEQKLVCFIDRVSALPEKVRRKKSTMRVRQD